MKTFQLSKTTLDLDLNKSEKYACAIKSLNDSMDT